MNEDGSRSATRIWLVAPVAVGGVVGLVFGLQIRAGQGYDCPPLPGLSSTLFTMALVALCVVLLVVAFVALLVGRKWLAGAVFVAAFSIAIGTAAGLAIGRPVDNPQCSRPTSTTEPAVLTLNLGDPFNEQVAGPGTCERDIATGTVLVIARADQGAGVTSWVSDDLRVADIAMGYGLTDPGLQIGLLDRASGRHVAYRQTATGQVTQVAAADQRSGTVTYRDLPFLADGSAPPPSLFWAQLSGSIDWRCPDDAMEPR